jgi:signal peptidase
MTTIPEGERPVRRRRGLRRKRAATAADRVRTGIWSLLVVVVLAAAGIATFSVLSGGWTVTPILSGSMRPGFPVGGVAVAERMPMGRLAVGDVILFQNPYQPSVQMVHRIIQLKAGNSGQPVVKTKGDANPIADPWTVTLHGKDVDVVQFTLPLLGYPAVDTNHGVDLMVGGVIILLAVVGTVLTRERRATGGRPQPDLHAPWPAPQLRRPAVDEDSRSNERVRRDARSSDERPGAPPVVADRDDSTAPEGERSE